MNRILLFCALGALWGCRAVTEPTAEAITLSCSPSESAKVGALTAGDEVAVYARIEGTENYFLEGEKFITGSDGRSLTYGSTVYYPEPKQAVNFYAYVPYHTGTFSVPTDQSTAAALKQADLCWANASSTPVATPVSLTFQHLFARLIVQTNEPTAKIACQIVPSGVLNAATAQFTLTGGKREVFTTGSELIVPVQPLNRLILTVSGIDYVFEGSINLQAGQTTTLNLTLHPSTQTATLNGSSTTNWIASSQNGSLEQTVSNVLTLHWANYVPQGTTPDKIILTINGTDYTINSGITYANKTFTVPFASNQLRYPYTISKITFSAIPLACAELLGATIYKSGAQTLGIKDVPNAIYIDRGGYKLWWATGNLVADGQGGCKIGLSTDVGVLFSHGGLIAYSNGAAGNGVGPWVNVSPYQPVAVPKEYTGSTAWPGVSLSGTLSGSELPSSGTGDPCRYYLKGQWRLATWDEVSYQFTGTANFDYTANTPLPGFGTEHWSDKDIVGLSHFFGGKLSVRMSVYNTGDGRWSYGWYFPGWPASYGSTRICNKQGINLCANGVPVTYHSFYRTDHYSYWMTGIRCVRDAN